MLDQLLMGIDESTLAYDLQRAHSADLMFMRFRFWFWGFVSTVCGFLVGHVVALSGYNIFSGIWGGLLDFWHHLF